MRGRTTTDAGTEADMTKKEREKALENAAAADAAAERCRKSGMQKMARFHERAARAYREVAAEAR